MKKTPNFIFHPNPVRIFERINEMSWQQAHHPHAWLNDIRTIWRQRVLVAAIATTWFPCCFSSWISWVQKCLRKLPHHCHTSAFFVYILDFKSFIFVICVGTRWHPRKMESGWQWTGGMGWVVRLEFQDVSLHCMFWQVFMKLKKNIRSVAQDLVPVVHT